MTARNRHGRTRSRRRRASHARRRRGRLSSRYRPHLGRQLRGQPRTVPNPLAYITCWQDLEEPPSSLPFRSTRHRLQLPHPSRKKACYLQKHHLRRDASEPCSTSAGGNHGGPSTQSYTGTVLGGGTHVANSGSIPYFCSAFILV